MEGTNFNGAVCGTHDGLQLTTETNEIILQAGAFKEILNAKNYEKFPVFFKNCKDIHIGPKIEIHSEHPEICMNTEKESESSIYANCRKKMKHKYLTYFSYMRSFLWEGKRNDFPLKDYFIQLTVEKADLFGKKCEEKINLKEMFSQPKDEHETILITGDPGYGKSTLCKKIAYDWASEEYLQHFHLTVVVLLRELNYESKNHTILQEIQQNFTTYEQRRIQGKDLNFLVLLDGFDELIEKNKVVKFITEDSFDISYRMTILVTSRPQATEDIREYMTRRFSIEGFSPEHQKKYIKLMFREDPSETKYLISKLSCDDFYIQIAECPLMLHMLCCLHRVGDMEKIESITDLYIQIFSVLTERYVRKSNQKDQFERGRHFFGEELLRRLGKISLTCNEMTSENLEKNFPNEKEYNFIIGLDILTLESYSQLDTGVRYDFLHRTFSEFLSALTVYGDFSVIPETVSENTLLFLLGFYGKDPFPQKLLYQFHRRIFTPYFMLRAHKEIKSEVSWEELCFLTKVIFSGDNLDDARKLLSLYSFKEFYFIFSDSFWHSYPTLQGFDEVLTSPNLTIYVYLRDSSHGRFCKFIDSVSSLLNFFSHLISNFDRSKIYFNGIYNSNHKLHFIKNDNYLQDLCEIFLDNSNMYEEEDFLYYRDVKYSMRLCEDILNNASESEDANLQCFNNMNYALDLREDIPDDLVVSEDSNTYTNYENLNDKYSMFSWRILQYFLQEGKKINFSRKYNYVKLTVKKTGLFGKKSGEKIRLNEIFSDRNGDLVPVCSAPDDPQVGTITDEVMPEDKLLNRFLNRNYTNCREKLKKRYEIIFARTRAFLWEDTKNDFPLKDYFARLAVEKAKSFYVMIKLNEIFCNKEDGHQTILVTGYPGYGKTTLCKKIAYDWATMDYLEHFYLTVVIFVGEFGNKSIKDALLYKIEQNLGSKEKSRLQENQNFLVILDGFDRLPKKHKLVKFVRQDSFDISHRMTILVTSRTGEIKEISEDIKHRFIITGFCQDDQKKYIQVMFREDQSKAKDFISKLNNKIYRELSMCPPIFHIYCCLHQNGELKRIKSRTDLYIRAFSLITERYVQKHNQNEEFAKGKYFRGEELLYKLGKLTENFQITTKDLMKTFPNKNEYDFIFGLGILTFSSISKHNITSYRFLHNMFREFLSAFVMYRDFSNFLHFTTERTFLFLLGFYGSELYPNTLFCNLEKRFFDPKFMIEARQEIKLEQNWEKFCSIIKVRFLHHELNDTRELLKLYPFKVLNYIFEVGKDFYEYEKQRTIDRLNNFISPNNCKIYLYLLKSYDNIYHFYDIREPISGIIDVFRNVKLTNFQVHFIGISPSYERVDYFKNINYSVNLSEDHRRRLDLLENENVIALETLTDKETVNRYIMTMKQYQALRSVMTVYSNEE